jgi:anti-sigma regulatory factor (Ser/Thr protein kinase)
MNDPEPLALPFTLDAPALARQYLNTHAAHLPPADLEDAMMLTSELVTNAVEYGRPDVVLSVGFDPPLIKVSVADCGQIMDQTVPSLPAETSIHGRGLRIVDATASSWGVVEGPGPGKSVWFQIEA